MTFTSVPAPFSPIGAPLLCTLADADPAGTELRILDAEGRRLGTKRPVTRTLSEIEPTRTQPTEDPRYGALCRSANERAYAEDARRFGRN